MNEEAQSPNSNSGTRWLVSGRVQRVGFRAATRRQAERLGLRGYARNLPDGRVEVVATGEPAAVLELWKWLNKGPTLARVDRVEEAGECEITHGSFSTG